MNSKKNSQQAISDSVVLSLSMYSLNAIKKTCYKFSSEFSVKFEKIDDDQIKVSLNFNPSINHTDVEEIIRQFHNELLDQDLREIVFKETENVRNLILAHAFSKTSLIES
jgi:His-Xaa-Ser system protein HxsD